MKGILVAGTCYLAYKVARYVREHRFITQPLKLTYEQFISRIKLALRKIPEPVVKPTPLAGAEVPMEYLPIDPHGNAMYANPFDRLTF